MEHEVPAIDVLHDEEEMVPGLEAGVESGQEGRFLLHGQNLALVEGTLHIILLDDQILLQALDGVHFTAGLMLSKKHLQEFLLESQCSLCL